MQKLLAARWLQQSAPAFPSAFCGAGLPSSQVAVSANARLSRTTKRQQEPAEGTAIRTATRGSVRNHLIVFHNVSWCFIVVSMGSKVLTTCPLPRMSQRVQTCWCQHIGKVRVWNYGVPIYWALIGTVHRKWQDFQGQNTAKLL